MINSSLSPNDALNQYINNAQRTQVSASKSTFNGFAEGVTYLPIVPFEINSYLRQQPLPEDIQSFLDNIEVIKNAPMSTTARAGQEVGNLVGSLIGGYGTSFLGGKAASVAVRGINAVAPGALKSFAQKSLTSFVGNGLEKYLPTKLAQYGEEVLTVGESGTKLATEFGKGAGFVLPQEVADNYDRINNKFDFGNIVKGTIGYGGAISLLPSLIPYGVGVAWGKLRLSLGKEAADLAYEIPEAGFLKGKVPANVAGSAEPHNDSHPLLNRMWQAHEKGNMTRDMYDGFRDYLVDGRTEGIQRAAAKDLIANGQQVDLPNGRAIVNLLNQDQAKSLKSALLDQVASNTEEGIDTDLSDYIIKNKIADLKSDNTTLDGLRGVISHLETKISAKSEHLSEINSLRSHPELKHIDENHPLSQKKILNRVKKTGDTQPFTIPKEVSRYQLFDKRISRLNSKISKIYNSQLDSIESDINKLNTELEDLKKSKFKKSNSIIDKLNETTDINERKSKLAEFKKDNSILELDNNFPLNKLNKILDKKEWIKELESIKNEIKKSWAEFLERGKGKSSKSKEKFKGIHHDKINYLQSKINNIEKERGNILSPDEELSKLENSFLNISANLKSSRKLYSSIDYSRLRELAIVSPKAELLLRQIELARHYVRQEGYKDLIQHIIKTVESSVMSPASADNVVSYMKRRLDKTAPEYKPKPLFEEPLHHQEVPQDANQILKEKIEATESRAPELAQGYKELSDRFDEFKSKESVFNSFIKCLAGGK